MSESGTTTVFSRRAETRPRHTPVETAKSGGPLDSVDKSPRPGGSRPTQPSSRAGSSVGWVRAATRGRLFSERQGARDVVGPDNPPIGEPDPPLARYGRTSPNTAWAGGCGTTRGEIISHTGALGRDVVADHARPGRRSSGSRSSPTRSPISWRRSPTACSTICSDSTPAS